MREIFYLALSSNIKLIMLGTNSSEYACNLRMFPRLCPRYFLILLLLSASGLNAQDAPDMADSPQATPDTADSPQATPDAADSPQATPDAADSPQATPDTADSPQDTPDTFTDRVGLEGSELDQIEREFVLFERIGMGISLSLSECQTLTSCPLLGKDEMKNLLNELDQRIAYLQRLDIDASQGITQKHVAFKATWDDYTVSVKRLIDFIELTDEEGQFTDLERALDMLDELLSAYDIGLPEDDDTSELFSDTPPLSPELQQQIDAAQSDTAPATNP